MEPLFYTKLTEYYDKIYHYIDYKKQTKFILKIIRKFKTSNGNKLLDVACGTGTHIQLLKKHFEIVGLDKNKEMLEIARKKNPSVKFVQGDMQSFSLHKFDVILCYFNSILYNTTKGELSKTLTNFWKHLDKGGLLIFNAVDKIVGIDSRKDEWWYKDKNLNILFAPQWIYKNRKLHIDIDFVIEKKRTTEHLKDHHVMGAFSLSEIGPMLKKIGFKVNVFETNYEEMQELNPDSWQAIFVCQKN